MEDNVKLSRLQNVLTEISYPVSHQTAVEAFDDVTVLLADGEQNLGDLVEQIPADQFRSPGDLYTELNNVMPIEALGEPGQSDGDA
ncbi:hypothetical protein [Natronocalculus amylovorans]|uniref:DUF2795 domain-containing protein n=1 Tax=Natronocalculus amylovorans TaxID=2917812 RepID=A0AAE3FXA5_9EURY|nr:hypothetical protein [Natronocalculus amylovorans]MCL9817087.1 hypothetical protein [Natronocalculus amylovorans]NUE02885.1 hypothetical protein [Halorubraceae archaeon YAN]